MREVILHLSATLRFDLTLHLSATLRFDLTLNSDKLKGVNSEGKGINNPNLEGSMGVLGEKPSKSLHLERRRIAMGCNESHVRCAVRNVWNLDACE